MFRWITGWIWYVKNELHARIGLQTRCCYQPLVRVKRRAYLTCAGCGQPRVWLGYRYGLILYVAPTKTRASGLATGRRRPAAA